MILGYYVMIVLTGVLLFYLIPQMALYYSLLLVATTLESSNGKI
jgi:hypothetical protein